MLRHSLSVRTVRVTTKYCCRRYNNAKISSMTSDIRRKHENFHMRFKNGEQKLLFLEAKSKKIENDDLETKHDLQMSCDVLMNDLKNHLPTNENDLKKHSYVWHTNHKNVSNNNVCMKCRDDLTKYIHDTRHLLSVYQKKIDYLEQNLIDVEKMNFLNRYSETVLIHFVNLCKKSCDELERCMPSQDNNLTITDLKYILGYNVSWHQTAKKIFNKILYSPIFIIERSERFLSFIWATTKYNNSHDPITGLFVFGYNAMIILYRLCLIIAVFLMIYVFQIHLIILGK